MHRIKTAALICQGKEDNQNNGMHNTNHRRNCDTHLRVNISELREISIRSIGKELSNRFDIGLDFVLRLGPRVELGIWIEARVEIVDPSDIILRKLLENRTLWQAKYVE